MPGLSDLNQLKERLAPLCANPDVELVILFGSAVSGTTHPESDLDVAIQGRQPLDVVETTNQVIRLLRTDRVDVVDLRRASPLLMMEIARGGMLLYEREPGLYVAFCSLAHRRYVDTAKLRAAQREAIQHFLRARGVA